MTPSAQITFAPGKMPSGRITLPTNSILFYPQLCKHCSHGADPFVPGLCLGFGLEQLHQSRFIGDLAQIGYDPGAAVYQLFVGHGKIGHPVSGDPAHARHHTG